MNDTIYYRGSDLVIEGTHGQLKEEARRMARVEGAKGTINEGAIGDIPLEQEAFAPEQTRTYTSMVEKGEVTPTEPEQDPGSTDWQVANAMVRGDELSHPTDAAKAEQLVGREYAIVHTGDEDASPEEATPEHKEGEYRTPRRFDPGEDYTFAGVSERNREAVGSGSAPAATPAPAQTQTSPTSPPPKAPKAPEKSGQ